MFHRVHIPGLVLAFCVAASCAVAEPARVIAGPNDDGSTSSQKVQRFGFTNDADSNGRVVVFVRPTDGGATSVRQQVRGPVSGNDTSPRDQVVRTR